MHGRNLQPQFPPRYTKENGLSIDWGNCGLIAYASGACVHLVYLRGRELAHVSSIEVAPHPISCFKFHLTLRAIAIADAKGRLFLYDIEHWRFVASAKPLKASNEVCVAMDWFEDVLLVLTSHRRLIAVQFGKGMSTGKLSNMSILWEMMLPKEFVRISIDPHYAHLLLLSTRANSFGLYYMNTPREKPELFVDIVELTEPAAITDAQWSIHMPGYVFIVLDRDLLLFHIQTRGLIAMIDRNHVISGFSFLVQFPGDHRKLLTVHKVGAISVYEGDDEMWYSLGRSVQASLGGNGIVSAALSPTDDAFLAVFSETQGLGLMDLERMRITSMDLTFPSEITAYDSDAEWYILGTDEGYVVTGSLYNTSETKRFRVSDEAIRFVSFDAQVMCAYWQTSKDLGMLDVRSRSNVVFNSKMSSSIRCYGSHCGALIVMRDVTALGVFVDGKEKPLLFTAKIADVAVDESSTQQGGMFTILLADLTVIFYKYSSGNGLEEVGRGAKLRGIESAPLSIATRKDEYAIGFSSGVLIFVNTVTGAVRRVFSESTHVRALVYGKGDNDSLYGLCRDNIMFECSQQGKVRTCAYPVESFKVINAELLMAKATDGIVKFINIAEWEPLSYTSRFMPPPDENQMTRDFIETRPRHYFHRFARDAWLTVTEKTNLRLQAVAGTSPSGLAEEINFALLNRVDTEHTKEVEAMKFVSLLFQKRLEEAVNMRPLTMVEDPTFVVTALSSIFIMMSQDGIDERAQAQLKASAVKLFANNQYDDGILMMRIGSLDKEAAEYLIDMDKHQLALRFLRSTVADSDKRLILFKLGAKLYGSQRKKEAITIFAASGEYHAVLSILLDLSLVADAHLLLTYLKQHDKLRVCSVDFPGLRKFETMCTDIENEYVQLCDRLSLN